MRELLGIDSTRSVSPIEMLGLGEGHNELWAAAERNITQGLPPDWSFLGDYNSAVDAPASAFWPELLKANPKAKVVLTFREPASWHRSINSAWCRILGAGGTLDRVVSKITFLRPYGICL
jgi:hypothetical protein